MRRSTCVELIAKLNLPSWLRDVDVPQEALPGIAEHVTRDFTVATNPRRIENPDEMRERCCRRRGEVCGRAVCSYSCRLLESITTQPCGTEYTAASVVLIRYASGSCECRLESSL